LYNKKKINKAVNSLIR